LHIHIGDCHSDTQY